MNCEIDRLACVCNTGASARACIHKYLFCRNLFSPPTPTISTNTHTHTHAYTSNLFIFLPVTNLLALIVLCNRINSLSQRWEPKRLCGVCSLFGLQSARICQKLLFIYYMQSSTGIQFEMHMSIADIQRETEREAEEERERD